MNSKHIPSELEDYVLPFNWDVKRLWKLPCVVQDIRRPDLDYLLHLTLWSSQANSGMLFDLAPIDVIRHPACAPHQAERISTTDTRYPLEFLDYRGRSWILDGVHRLAKLYIRGASSVRIRRHEASVITSIRVA